MKIEKIIKNSKLKKHHITFISFHTHFCQEWFNASDNQFSFSHGIITYSTWKKFKIRISRKNSKKDSNQNLVLVAINTKYFNEVPLSRTVYQLCFFCNERLREKQRTSNKYTSTLHFWKTHQFRFCYLLNPPIGACLF